MTRLSLSRCALAALALMSITSCAPEPRWVRCCGGYPTVFYLRGRETSPGIYECPCTESGACSDIMQTCGRTDASVFVLDASVANDAVFDANDDASTSDNDAR
jgi:hypothetical protein